MRKALLIASLFLGLFLLPFLIFDMLVPMTDLSTARWQCVQSHNETRLRKVGRHLRLVTESVCDTYRRR